MPDDTANLELSIGLGTFFIILGIIYLVEMRWRRFNQTRIRFDRSGIDLSRISHRMDGQLPDHPVTRPSSTPKAARVTEARQRVANQTYFRSSSPSGDQPPEEKPATPHAISCFF